MEKSKGIALVNALVLSIMVGVFTLTLYFAFNRLFKATEEARTYTSIKEAAASGARYGASMTNFPAYWRENRCVVFNQEFRIIGRSEMGRTQITVCRIGSVFVPGREISGVSREPTTSSATTGAFKITSISRFPANNPVQEARVEAVYVR